MVFHQDFSSVSPRVILSVPESEGMSDTGIDTSLGVGCQKEKLPAQVKDAVYYQAQFLTALEERPCETLHKTLCLVAVTSPLLPILFCLCDSCFGFKKKISGECY